LQSSSEALEVIPSIASSARRLLSLRPRSLSFQFVRITWLANGKHFLIDLVRKQCDYPTLSQLVLDRHGKHKLDALLIEDHGSGTGLVQDLKRRHGISATPILPTGDKIVRLSIVSLMFERGEIFLTQNAPWLMDFLILP
jgi:predicted phage terminase large subunit-like protein